MTVYRITFRSTVFSLGLLALSTLAGCYSSPLDRTLEEQLAEQVSGQYRNYVDAVKDSPKVKLSRSDNDVLKDLTGEQKAEIKKMSGMSSYKGVPMKLGKDLHGASDSPTVTMTLQRVIQLTVQNNLSVSQAKLQPAINDTVVTQAEAVFDAVYFANLTYNKTDTPRPTSALTFLGPVRGEETGIRTGIRKQLSTGATVTLETGTSRTQQNPSSFSGTGGQFTFHDADVLFNIQQPLLRGFGSDVNRSDILLAQSGKKQSTQQMRSTLLDAVATAEQAYWTLVFTRSQLLIQQRLLKRHMEDVTLIEKRGDFDQSKAALMQARSFSESARAQVIRASENVRIASDALKRLINSDDLPLAGETLVVPLDAPIDAPVDYSLADTIRTALQHRPEVQISLMQISDATIRQRVADNLRLPLFNVGAGIRYNGNDTDDTGGAYSNLADGDFIDYLFSADFEIPIGNRSPEALLDQRKLERRAAVIGYQNTAQETVLEVKNALRNLRAAYELIGAAKASRQAETQNLRTFIVKQEAGRRPDETFMDQKLRSEQRLAQSEIEEVNALTAYNNAISELYRAMGTLLDRNNIVVDAD